MEETKTMIDGIIEKFSQQIVDKFDDKLKECCLVWGVNVDDHEEIARRCEIGSIEGSDRKELRIDGYIAMIYEPFKSNEFNPYEPFKMGGSFKCSEIFKPIK